jgi:hypothetical protein
MGVKLSHTLRAGCRLRVFWEDCWEQYLVGGGNSSQKYIP